jgi:hypothetical protein
MKVTIEIEVDSLDEIPNVLNKPVEIANEYLWVCPSRLRLLKDVHNLAKSCAVTGRPPSLTESKDTVWPHFYEKVIDKR